MAGVSTDEIYERYLQKAITEINRLSHEIAQAADGAPTALPTGHPMANIFLLKFGPQDQELQEGVAFHGRAGNALIKSLQRLHVDPLEVYNARLIFEAQNDEALRFARKYDLTMGAGSDAHVLQGVGTGSLRMRAFRDPEEFLISLRTAEILRRPKSLAYLQSLKWVAQVKEKVR